MGSVGACRSLAQPGKRGAGRAACWHHLFTLVALQTPNSIHTLESEGDRDGVELQDPAGHLNTALQLPPNGQLP